MKNLFIAAFVFITFLEANAEKIQVADLAINKSDGEILLYYRDGNEIVIRNCSEKYKSVNRREDCSVSAPEVRVSRNYFKRYLLNSFQIAQSWDDKKNLKPMTNQDIDALQADKPEEYARRKQEKQRLMQKLSEIEEFVDSNGLKKDERWDYPKKIRDDLEKVERDLKYANDDILLHESHDAAVKKVNDIIAEIINKITSADAEKVSFVKHSDTAMFNLLKVFDPGKIECGTDDYLNGVKQHKLKSAPKDEEEESGALKAAWIRKLFIPEAVAAEHTLADRIKDCAVAPNSTIKTSSGVVWNLVVRRRDSKTKSIAEVWKDSKSGLLWGSNVIHKDYGADGFYSSKEWVAAGNRIDVCQTEAGAIANAMIRDKVFGTPRSEEFLEADKHGLSEVLPNFQGNYWSENNEQYIASGTLKGFPKSSFAYTMRAKVRCVGR